MSELYQLDQSTDYTRECLSETRHEISGFFDVVEVEHRHQWLPWLTLPNGSSWTQCTGCGEQFQYDH